MIHTISSSDGTHLRFEPTDRDLLERFLAERADLENRYYWLLRRRNGIWASNQDRYVETREELKEFDSKVMEDRLG